MQSQGESRDAARNGASDLPSRWGGGAPAPGLSGTREVEAQDTLELSALMDGEAEPARIGALLERVQREARPREAWSTYHLIGDVMRSSDLARPCDDALVLRVRAALAREPVVLAPAPLARPRFPRWRAPAAAVAGVALVAGTWSVVNLRQPTRDAQTSASLAARDTTASAPQLPTAAMLRDAHLDRYLQAHQEFAGATALGASSGLVRATVRDPSSR